MNGQPVQELCTIVHASKAQKTGKHMCEKLLDIVPRQQFEIAIQAAVGAKILARTTLKSYRKDVTGKLVNFKYQLLLKINQHFSFQITFFFSVRW